MTILLEDNIVVNLIQYGFLENFFDGSNWLRVSEFFVFGVEVLPIVIFFYFDLDFFRSGWSFYWTQLDVVNAFFLGVFEDVSAGLLDCFLRLIDFEISFGDLNFGF